MHHCGSLSDPPHEKDSFIRETCIRDLPWHAGAKRGLRGHDLAGHVPHSRPRPRPYAGTCLYVNSFHHQAVNAPGKEVAVSARAQDGTIEAIELKGHPFAVGVQWHPECMYRRSPEMRNLFHEFIFHSLITGGKSGHTTS